MHQRGCKVDMGRTASANDHLISGFTYFFALPDLTLWYGVSIRYKVTRVGRRIRDEALFSGGGSACRRIGGLWGSESDWYFRWP